MFSTFYAVSHYEILDILDYGKIGDIIIHVPGNQEGYFRAVIVYGNSGNKELKILYDNN